jgi:hypothetical protein
MGHPTWDDFDRQGVLTDTGTCDGAIVSANNGGLDEAWELQPFDIAWLRRRYSAMTGVIYERRSMPRSVQMADAAESAQWRRVAEDYEGDAYAPLFAVVGPVASCSTVGVGTRGLAFNAIRGDGERADAWAYLVEGNGAVPRLVGPLTSEIDEGTGIWRPSYYRPAIASTFGRQGQGGADYWLTGVIQESLFADEMRTLRRDISLLMYRHGSDVPTSRVPGGSVYTLSAALLEGEDIPLIRSGSLSLGYDPRSDRWVGTFVGLNCDTYLISAPVREEGLAPSDWQITLIAPFAVHGVAVAFSPSMAGPNGMLVWTDYGPMNYVKWIRFEIRPGGSTRFAGEPRFLQVGGGEPLVGYSVPSLCSPPVIGVDMASNFTLCYSAERPSGQAVSELQSVRLFDFDGASDTWVEHTPLRPAGRIQVPSNYPCLPVSIAYRFAPPLDLPPEGEDAPEPDAVSAAWERCTLLLAGRL